MLFEGFWNVVHVGFLAEGLILERKDVTEEKGEVLWDSSEEEEGPGGQ